jgi:hypothetical protein
MAAYEFIALPRYPNAARYVIGAAEASKRAPVLDTGDEVCLIEKDEASSRLRQ